MLGFSAIGVTSLASLPEADSVIVSSISAVTWQFLADWDSDGAFSGYDDITADVQQAEWKLGFTKPYQLTADESTCRLTMRNDTRKYSPEYSGGTLYTKLVPHKFMQIRSISEAGTVTHWTGWIDTISPTPLEIGEQRSVINGRGAKHFYDETVVHLDIYEDARASDILPDVIKEVILPPSIEKVWRLDLTGFAELGTNTILPDYGYFYSMETGRSVYPYAGDTWADETASNVIYDLVAGEPGRFYFHRDGRAIFWNRHHLAADITNDGNVTTYTNGNYVYGDDIRNRILVKNYPRLVSATANDTLWQLDEPVTIKPGKDRKLRASYKDADSKNRVGATDVQMPTVAASTLVYTPANLSLYIDLDVKGDSAEIQLRNDTAYDITISTLILKGKKITTFEDQTFTVEDVTSVTAYSAREMTIDTKMMNDETLAVALAEYELLLRKTPRGQFKTVTLRPKDDTTRAQAIQYSIGTRINLADTQVAHNADYFIMGEQHRLGAGWLHDVTWNLEPAAVFSAWQLNESLLDTTTILSI